MPGKKSLPLLRSESAGDDADAPPDGGLRVLLVCPPFQHLLLSSLSVAHLATFLREKGVQCSEHYPYFELARLLGIERYRRIPDGSDGLIGELLFAESLHGDCADAALERRLTEFFGPRTERALTLERLENVCIAHVVDAQAELVGLTTSLNQLMPALWIARAVKRHYPQVRVVLGGAAVSEPMADRVLEGYPYVDYVVSGFGEQPLLELARGAAPEQRLMRSNHSVHLDSMPIPDYAAFLRDAGEFGDDPKLMLTYESSRGCWWGEKHHCKFCGLNGLEMTFNAKSSQRVVREIRTLWERHHRPLFATDAIMAREHLKGVMPELARFDDRPRLFYEVKANMTQADVVVLRRANVLGLQPGVESLSTRILKLLDKGINAIRNLALLKWCRERDVAIAWNQLCGVPGESVEDYDEQIALMRLIPQLAPPDRANPVRIDRYSPYFKHYEKFGWRDLEPFAEYRALHPHLDETQRRGIAYHFRGVGGVSTDPYFERFAAAVSEWQERNARGEGLFLDPEQGLVHARPGGAFRYNRNEVLERVLECTHDLAVVPRVLEHARCSRSVLDQLVQHGILYMEDNLVLNLAIRTKPPEEV
jgi:ribosomal peptide maturation radical SAM protein 1